MTPSGLTDEQLALTVNPTYTQDSVATVSKNLIWSNFNTQFNAITANMRKRLVACVVKLRLFLPLRKMREFVVKRDHWRNRTKSSSGLSNVSDCLELSLS